MDAVFVPVPPLGTGGPDYPIRAPTPVRGRQPSPQGSRGSAPDAPVVPGNGHTEPHVRLGARVGERSR